MESIFFIVGLGFLIIVTLYIKEFISQRKYTKAFGVFNQYGYKRCVKYNSRGVGYIYRKQVDNDSVDSLLLRYKFEPLEFNIPYKIFDNVALIEYPEREERYYGAVADHGGVRIVHFFTLEVKIGEKFYQRPYSIYLANDMSGEVLAPVDLESPELIEIKLCNDMRDRIETFNDKEIEYWKTKIK